MKRFREWFRKNVIEKELDSDEKSNSNEENGYK